MSTTALASAHQQTQSIQRPHPLLSVLTWELRRCRASRLFWVQVFCFFCFLLFLIGVQAMADQYSTRLASVFIAGTSAWGLVLTLPSTVLLLVLLLPFVNADGVTRDLHRRTHELLMTTVLPTRAYVWGRYLIGLLMSLGLALLILVAILGMGLLFHLTVATYPAPQIGDVLLLWVGMVIPATALVSSLSFALGTLLPRLTTMIKIVILVGWIIGAEVLPFAVYLPSGSTGFPAWYINWDPTSTVTALSMFSQYSLSGTTDSDASQAQLQQIVLAVENKMPDIGGWFAPHLLLAGLSLVLVLVAALLFKRSRDMLN